MKIKIFLLKAALFFFAGILLLFTGLMGIQIFTSEQMYIPISVLIFMGAILLSVFFAFRVLYYLWKVVNLIGNHLAFSVKTLFLVKKIKTSILLIGFSFCWILPFVYRGAQADDAPGLMLAGIAIVLIPFAVFIFSQIVEELFRSAIELKTENDLTV